MKQKRFFLATILLGILLIGCKKYEEGPAFSLRTKKARISGSWVLEKYLVDGVDETASYLGGYSPDLLEIEKSGDFKYTDYYFNGSIIDYGVWEFLPGKEEVKFKMAPSIGSEFTYKILKLKNNEFWYRWNVNGSNRDYHFKAK
ncbi:MAG: hypothetical protein J0M08_03855 [Bacteroidetes bacterium]|nr:hypothetical protein [Bacteroidota bacterium]